MATVTRMFERPDDLRKKILITAAVVVVLMVLFPPKYVAHHIPILGQTSSQSVGYHFVLNDPAAAEKAALGDTGGDIVSSGIEWGKLFLQIVVVCGIAFGAMYFVNNQRPSAAGNTPAPS